MSNLDWFQNIHCFFFPLEPGSKTGRLVSERCALSGVVYFWQCIVRSPRSRLTLSYEKKSIWSEHPKRFAIIFKKWYWHEADACNLHAMVKPENSCLNFYCLITVYRMIGEYSKNKIIQHRFKERRTIPSWVYDNVCVRARSYKRDLRMKHMKSFGEATCLRSSHSIRICQGCVYVEWTAACTAR